MRWFLKVNFFRRQNSATCFCGRLSKRLLLLIRALKTQRGRYLNLQTAFKGNTHTRKNVLETLRYGSGAIHEAAWLGTVSPRDSDGNERAFNFQFSPLLRGTWNPRPAVSIHTTSHPTDPQSCAWPQHSSGVDEEVTAPNLTLLLLLL